MTDREKKATKNASRTVRGTIAAMPAPYRAMGERLHALILRSASALQPTLWYGLSAYAKDGQGYLCLPRGQIYDLRP